MLTTKTASQFLTIGNFWRQLDCFSKYNVEANNEDDIKISHNRYFLKGFHQSMLGRYCWKRFRAMTDKMF